MHSSTEVYNNVIYNVPQAVLLGGGRDNTFKNNLIIDCNNWIEADRRGITSYIFEYLKSINKEEIIDMFDLKPFEIQVQALKRTFIDKLFAISDYYLSDNTDEHSRHLYDLYKITERITINDSLKQLFHIVREERKKRKTCVSAQDGINIRDCIMEIISTDVFKKDYEVITKPLIFDNVQYETVKKNLKNILDSDLLI